jgi:dihydrofolate reductase
LSKVVLDMSMSLDGFATAAGQTAEEPMGPGGLKLVEWAIHAEDAVSRELVERSVGGVGAVIVGRRTYDTSLPWWGENGPTGDADMPVFVLTHTETAQHGVYRFVTDGPESAVAQAKATAGDKTVAVSGAAAGQALLRAGLLDEISVHVVPVLFGSGTRLFDDLGGEHVSLTRLEVVDAPTATHMRFRVERDQAAGT